MNNQESISGAKALKEAEQRIKLAEALKILDYSKLYFDSGKLKTSFFSGKKYIFLNISQFFHDKRPLFPKNLSDTWHYVCLGLKSEMEESHLDHCRVYAEKHKIMLCIPERDGEVALFKPVQGVEGIEHASLYVQCMLAKLDVFINKLPLSGRLFVLNSPEDYEVRELLTLLKIQVDNENKLSPKPNTTAIENYFTNENVGLISKVFLKKITCDDDESKISKVLAFEPATMMSLLMDNATPESPEIPESPEKEKSVANALFANAFWGKLCMHQGESNMALGACVYYEFLSTTNATYTQDILNWKNEKQQTTSTDITSHFNLYKEQRKTEGHWGVLDIFLGLFMFTQEQKQNAVAAIKNEIKDDKFGSLSKIPQNQHGALLQGRLGEIVHALMDQSQYHRVHQQAQRSGFYWLRAAVFLKDEHAIGHRKDCLDNIEKVVESKSPIDKFHWTIAAYEKSGLTQVTVKDNKNLFDALNSLFDSTRGSDNFYRLLHDELLTLTAKQELIKQYMLPKMDGNLFQHQLLRKKNTALESYITCPLGNELATKLLPLLQWSDTSLEKIPHPKTLTEIQKISLFCNHYKPLITTYLTNKTIGGQSLVGDNQEYMMAMLWYELLMAGIKAFGIYDTDYGKNILAVSNDLCQHQKQKLSQLLVSHAQGIGFNMGMMRTLESICTLGTLLPAADIKLRDQVMKIGEKFKHEEAHADNTVILSILCVGTMLLGIAHVCGGIASFTESALILNVNAKALAKIPKWIKSAIHFSDHTMHSFFEHEPTGKLINSTLPALYEIFHIGEHGLKLWEPHAHHGSHDNHAHGNHPCPQWVTDNKEKAKKYKTARDSINSKTLYMNLSDLLMQVSPIKHDAITLIMMYFDEIYKPVTNKLRATDAFLLGDFWLSLILQGFHVRLTMVDIGYEKVAKLSNMDDLFAYLDELLWCYTPLLSHEHTLLMTQSGQAISILDLIFPPKLQVISNNAIHHLGIEPSLLPKRPQHVPLNTKLLRHASTYEIQTYKKLLSLDKDDKQTYGFSLQSLDKAERVHDASPSFMCVIDLKTQVSDLNKSNRLQLLDSQGQKYIKAMEDMLKKLENSLNENTDVIGKLTESKEHLSVILQIALNTANAIANTLVNPGITFATWEKPYPEFKVEGDMYINIERYLDRIAAMLILLEDKFTFNVTAIKFYPLFKKSKTILYEKALALGDTYPVINPDDSSVKREKISTENVEFFTRKSIKADGNCLFSSIIEGIQSIPKKQSNAYPSSVEELRTKVAHWYRSTSHKTIINASMSTLGQALDDARKGALAAKHKCPDKQSMPACFEGNELINLQDYKSYISKNGAWGSTAEIDLISLKLDLTIIVCATAEDYPNLPRQPEATEYVMLHQSGKNTQSPIITLWYDGANHYEVLLPNVNTIQESTTKQVVLPSQLLTKKTPKKPSKSFQKSDAAQAPNNNKKNSENNSFFKQGRENSGSPSTENRADEGVELTSRSANG